MQKLYRHRSRTRTEMRLEARIHPVGPVNLGMERRNSVLRVEAWVQLEGLRDQGTAKRRVS